MTKHYVNLKTIPGQLRGNSVEVNGKEYKVETEYSESIDIFTTQIDSTVNVEGNIYVVQFELVDRFYSDEKPVPTETDDYTNVYTFGSGEDRPTLVQIEKYYIEI